jgi:GalNAc-alpha-(1->4)-GalNAc-alpha-(1->3)-diNAcBac-PP-undecaprenol alpha-1,4-N-acetyl-D-galactosaminyltransferase
LEKYNLIRSDKQMKIAFTCNRLGLGGAERVICNFANKMVTDGNDAQIICLDILEGFHYFIEENVKIVQLDEGYKKRSGALSRKIAGLKNLWKLFVNLKKEKPDVVISFYTRQNCYSILVCKILGIPIIAAERDHFFINDSRINRLLRKIFYPKADGFIHQTEWARTYLREHCGIIREDIVLPNPIWIEEYPVRNPISKNVISVGRLEEQKNYKGLFRAFKLVNEVIPDATLNIYGEGIQREELEILSNNLGLEKSIILRGSTSKILDCYAQADVFVLFSHGEGYPNVLMEALAVGVPSIASNCPIGGPADMIVDGENGILVSLENEKELASKLIKLLNDENLKSYLSRNAKNIQQTNDFAAIYQKLMRYVKGTLRRSNYYK